MEELDLPGRVHNLLLDAEVETVGALMMTLSMGENTFLNIKGLGEKALEVVQEHLANYDGWEEVVEEVVEEAEETAVADAEEEATDAEEEVAEEEVVAEEEPEAEVETAVEAEAEVKEPVKEEPVVPKIDDLSQSLVDIPAVKPKKKKKAKPTVVIARPVKAPPIETEDEQRRGKKGKQLVLDEKSGEVVVKRKRKGSRNRPDWEDYNLEDEF